MLKVTGGGERRIKRVVFTRPLIEKVVAGEVLVTYRGRRMDGYYYLTDTRFKRAVDRSRVIHVYRSEEVDLYLLRDEDAQLAGVESVKELRSLLEKWYGEPVRQLYRNWFTLIPHP